MNIRHMKNLVFTVLILLQTSLLFSQVGIGTTAPRATLEISNNDNGGLLIPQYALTGNNDTTTVINPQGGNLVDGTLVYNTTNVTGGNALARGFVFWNSATFRWNEVGAAGAAGAAGWELTGNNVTNGQFLGSTNFQALQFRVSNNQVGLFHPNGGVAIGIGAAANNNNSTAIGRDAQATASNEAMAIGRNANASGFRSSALGYNTIASSNNAVAVGSETTASGLNSAAIGNTANASGQNATAIGFGATAPNPTTIILGNTDTNANNFSSSKVGIGTNDPEAKLQVNGSFRYVDGNQAAGSVLTSDANGNATWSAGSSSSSPQVMMRRFTAGGIGGNGFVFNFPNQSFNNIASSSFAGNSIRLPRGVYIVESELRLSSNNTVDWRTRLNGNEVPGSVRGSANPSAFNTNAGTVKAVAVFEITGATGVIDFQVTGGSGAGVFGNQCYVLIKKIS